MPRKGTSHNNPQYRMVCQVCGEIFIAKSTKAMFCSESCRIKRRSDLDKQRYRAQVLYEPKHCRECGMPFMPERRNMQFCSDECRQASNERHKKNRFDCMSYIDDIPKVVTPLDIKLKQYGCEGLMERKKAETIEMFCRVIIDDKEKK